MIFLPHSSMFFRPNDGKLMFLYRTSSGWSNSYVYYIWNGSGWREAFPPKPDVHPSDFVGWGGNTPLLPKKLHPKAVREFIHGGYRSSPIYRVNTVFYAGRFSEITYQRLYLDTLRWSSETTSSASDFLPSSYRHFYGLHDTVQQQVIEANLIEQ